MEQLGIIQPKQVGEIPGIAGLGQELVDRMSEYKHIDIEFGDCDVEFQTIFEALPLPAAVTQFSSGEILWANHRLGVTFGLSQTELIGHNAADFYYHPTDRQQLLCALSEHGSLHHYRIYAKRLDGTCFWTTASLQLLHINGGQIVLSIFHDLESNKATNSDPQIQSFAEELQQNNLDRIALSIRKPQAVSLEEQLQEKQRTLTTLLGNLPGMVYRCQNDRHWTMEFVSEGCFDLTGYSPSDLIDNRKLSFAQIVHPEDRDLIWEQVQVALQARQNYRRNYRIVVASGEEKWVWEQGCGVFSDEGELLGLEGFITDISEQKRAEEETQLLQTIVQAINDATDFHAALKVTLRLVCEATGWDFGEAWIPRAEDRVCACSRVWYASINSLKNSNRSVRELEWQPHSGGLPLQFSNESNGRDEPLNYNNAEIEIAASIPLNEFHRLSKIFTFSSGKGLVGRVWQSQQPEWIQDVSTTSSHFFHRTQIAKSAGLRAGFGVPIIADGQVLAVLVFFMFEARRKDTRLVELVTTVATQLGSVMQRKQVEEALRLAEEKYRSIFENAIEGIFQTTPDGHYLSANPALARIYGYESPDCLIADLTDISHQLYVDPNRRFEFIHLMQTQDAVSAFESQIYRRDGSVIWIVENARVVRDAQGKPLYYEGTVEDITERKQLEARLLHDALHDTLTGLANRALFVDRLQCAMKQVERCDRYLFAVLYLDLDRFKAINDSLGHGAGDQLLVTIAQRLEGCVRPRDTVARLGGDEFSILLDDIGDIRDAIAVAERLQQVVSQSFLLDGHEVFTTASIGITLNTTNRKQPGDFLRDADTAMYRAKELGKARYQIFDATMHTRAVALLQLESDLRRAIDHQEFHLYYQPIVSLTTGKLAGFEALLRWQHPDRGLVRPDEFIPIAEETGLIVPLGWWVLRQACGQMQGWHEQFPTTEPLMLNVNLAGQQFAQLDLIDRVQGILQETGLDPSSLRLEITESQIMKKAEMATAMLHQLRALQIQLCIDDFGTGYSSLSYLHRFPTNLLKIDRSFVTHMSIDRTSAEIVRTIVGLARNLGMAAIAEGIETAEQLTQLRAMNCELGQGYFFDPPLERDAATSAIAAFIQHQQNYTSPFRIRNIQCS